MGKFLRNSFSHPVLALGSTMLWGVIEWFALQSSRRPPQSKRVSVLNPRSGRKVDLTH